LLCLTDHPGWDIPRSVCIFVVKLNTIINGADEGGVVPSETIHRFEQSENRLLPLLMVVFFHGKY
jgi:hypothetical protein